MFCPFMSSAEKKVGCDTNCGLYLKDWTFGGKKYSQCAIVMQALEMDRLRAKMDQIAVTDAGYLKAFIS